MAVPRLAPYSAAYDAIAAGSVTAAMLGTDSVDSDEIKAGAVGYAELSDNNKRFTVVIRNVADALAADTWERAVFVAPFACKIISASIVSDAAIGADTNYATVSVQNKTQSQANASLALTAANATTAYTAKSLGAITNATLAANDVITFKKACTANGLIFTAAMLQLQIERAA